MADHPRRDALCPTCGNHYCSGCDSDCPSCCIHRECQAGLAVAVAALRVLEWLPETEGDWAECPCCGAIKADGHIADGCQLAAALSKFPDNACTEHPSGCPEGSHRPEEEETLCKLEELKHFHQLTGMDGLEFEKALDEATGLKDWTGASAGAMFVELLERSKGLSPEVAGQVKKQLLELKDELHTHRHHSVKWAWEDCRIGGCIAVRAALAAMEEK